VTQWLNDRVPSIDPDRWALTVRSDQGEKRWEYQELIRHGEKLTATIDCTGGWFSRQEWTGVPLRKLVSPSSAGRSIVVHSTTGYSRRFPLRDLANLFVATGAGGAALSPGHGFPVRMVAPGRRGFWWVKWVDSVAIDDRPWWAELPFPAE
jgi:DMSO/TMAO reductase YedYZ molybdopterin-dependent catalytic subunit